VPAPLVTLETIAQIKHDGEQLEQPPTVADAAPNVCQTIRQAASAPPCWPHTRSQLQSSSSVPWPMS
jgi:hypothetical protein